jgi:GT2 family glycosyltransferase
VGGVLSVAAPTASVVIPNLNGCRFLDDCLRSVLDQVLEGGFEVILVDNASRDGSAEYVRAAYPAVRVLEPGRNSGAAGGCNLGLRAARGRYVAFLNNDVRVRPGWLRALVAAADAEPEAAAVDCKVLYFDRPDVINSAGIVIFEDGLTVGRGFEQPDRGQYEEREEVFAAAATGCLVRPEAIAEAGGFDETFVVYNEEPDLCWRLRLRGWKIFYEPRAVIEHKAGGGIGHSSDAFVFRLNRNILFTVLKNAAPRTAIAMLLRGGWHTPHQRHQLRIRARVLASFAWHLPEMLRKRSRIRGSRRVPDAEVERWIIGTRPPAREAGAEPALAAESPPVERYDPSTLPQPPNERFLWAVF